MVVTGTTDCRWSLQVLQTAGGRYRYYRLQVVVTGTTDCRWSLQVLQTADGRHRHFRLQMVVTGYELQVAAVAPIGNSDNSSLSAVISMVQAVPNLCVSRKVFLKHQVN